MAIQNRRGAYENFDPSKMVEGEVAIVKTGDPYGNNQQGYYYCYQTGRVTRLSDFDPNIATVARSWAVGTTSQMNMGSNQNNAKYWAEVAKKHASNAGASLDKFPYIGQNGNWYVYNVAQEQYIDSGADASITVQIADVTMLDPSASPRVTNSGTNTDCVFHLAIPRGESGKSAYQYAVDGGYTKSEEDFKQEMADASDSADIAQNAADRAESFYESINGGISFRGTIAPSEIPSNPVPGWEYMVTDSFVTDSRFEIPNMSVSPGWFIIYTANGKWATFPGESLHVEYDATTKTLIIN